MYHYRDKEIFIIIRCWLSFKKLGILGLSEAIAREEVEFNIHVNTIAPGASTPAMAAALAVSSHNYKPEFVAPSVSLLASESMPEP